MSWTVLNGDALEMLKTLPDESVHCCVTSPPYWGLRDYGVDGQLGLEPTPEEYVANMVEVFREVKQVLRKDGTLWLNLGDSYASDTKGSGGHNTKQDSNTGSWTGVIKLNHGLKPKDLVGIPWRVAFALQADGWWLRSDIIWAKPNPMPESVTDRPTKAHEYIFLFSKSERYYYSADSIKEPCINTAEQQLAKRNKKPHKGQSDPGGKRETTGGFTKSGIYSGRNKRTVWNISTKPFSEAHFATFPPEIPEICIKAGCPEGGTVLDPFAGAGTTLWVADQLGVNSIGIELNPEYCEIIKRRMASIEPDLFSGEAIT